MANETKKPKGFDLASALETEKQNRYTVDLPDGDTVELPPDIPWAALQKYQGMTEADISDALISETLELLFGKEDYEKIVEAGMRPGSAVQMQLYMDVMLHVRDMMMGDERIAKLMEENPDLMSSPTSSPMSRMNGTKPRKVKATAKAKRSR